MKILNRILVFIAVLVFVITFILGQKQVIIDQAGNIYVAKKQDDFTEYTCQKEKLKTIVKNEDGKVLVNVDKNGSTQKYELMVMGEGNVTSIHIQNGASDSKEKVYTFDKEKHVITNIEKTTSGFGENVIVRMALEDSRKQIVEDFGMYIRATIFLVLGTLFIVYRKGLSIVDNYIVSLIYEIKDVKKPNEIVSALIGIAGGVLFILGIVMYWMQFGIC